MRAFETLHPADRFEFRIRSEVPLAGGLGTSAAALVAGLMAADSLFELDADLLGLATRLEGHPDNVAAALLGGFVMCADGEATRLEMPEGLEAVLVVPAQVGPHRPRARRAARARSRWRTRCSTSPTPRCWPSASPPATSSSSRAGSPTACTSRTARTCTRARPSCPTGRRELGALGATISGAGPTVLVWTHYEATGPVMRRSRRSPSGWAEVRRAGFEPQGADVREL